MLKKIIHTFGIRAFSAVINLFVAILLSQYLGPEGKGVQSIIITTISFILIFANLVGGATLVYLTPRFSIPLLLVPSYAWTMIMSIIAYFVLLVTRLVPEPYIFNVCLLAVINSLMSIHSNILIGKQQIRESNQLVLIQTIALILSLLIAFVLVRHKGVDSYIYSLYVSFGVALVVSSYYIKDAIHDIRIFPLGKYIPVILQMFRYGAQNQAAHITQMLSFRLSYYVLQDYKGLAAVGVFSNGISIAESIWLVSKSMSLVQYSWVSNSNDRDASALLTIRLVKIGIQLSIVLIVPLMLLPVGGYTFVFGSGFAGVKPVILTLFPGVLVYNISILLGHYYSGTGRYHVNTIISSIGLVLSVILYFSLIPLYSVTGAGLATSLSYIFTSLLFLWYFSRDYKSWYHELIPKANDFSMVMSEIRKSLKYKS